MCPDSAKSGRSVNTVDRLLSGIFERPQALSGSGDGGMEGGRVGKVLSGISCTERAGSVRDVWDSAVC